MSGRLCPPRPSPFRRWVLLGLIAAMAALHAARLIARIRDLSIADPAVLARWVASLALLAAIVVIHRKGIPVLRGQRGAAIAVAALLLHAGSIPAVPTSSGLETFLLVLPLGLTAGLAGSALAPHRARRHRGSRPALFARLLHRKLPPLLRAPVLALQFVPRPPPLA